MTIIERNFTGETHFLLRLTFALAALVAVLMVWVIDLPGLQEQQVVATLDDPNCEACVELWIAQNISNVEQTVGVWVQDEHGIVTEIE